jgi:hypothetical protein
MTAQDILVRDIVNASGIVGRRARREVERELQSHVEEIVEDARAAGHSDQEIERIVRTRFGNPEEIAGGFARVYRPERTLVRIAEFTLLAAVSLTIILAFAYAVEVFLALGMGRPAAGVVSSAHLRTEVGFFAGLALGYLSLFFSSRIFTKYSLLKSILLSAAVFVAVCVGLQYWAPPQGIVLILGFASALIVRIVELLCSRSITRLAGVAAALSLVAMLAPSCLKPTNHPGILIAVAVLCLGISISCQFMITLARLFERRILRRNII